MKKYIFKIVKKIFFVLIRIFSVKKETIYLGTEYGGWSFIEPKNTSKLNVLSAGVGEDVSFDIEFLNKYNSNIYFVDPTPRAIQHMNKLIKNIGKPNTLPFNTNSGKQPINAYNLKDVDIANINVIEKALFNKSNLMVKFYLPKNKENVSHSISNFQNNFAKDTEHIYVETTTVSDILQKIKISNFDIIKLDIEGAEIAVLNHILSKKIHPNQILVEFDELNSESIFAYFKAIAIVIRLISNKYLLIHTNNFPNFLFLKARSIY